MCRGDARQRQAGPMTAGQFMALLGSFVMTACASATGNIAPDHVLTAGQGLVIGTITDPSPYANLPAMLYRKTGSGEENILQPDGGAGLIAVALPAGDYDYEVFSCRVTVEDGWIVPAKPFRIGFHVVSGEAVYLGSYDFSIEIHAQPRASSPVGNSLWSGEVTCTDQSGRDLKNFASRYPHLGAVPVSAIDSKACRKRLGDGSDYHGQNFPQLDF